MDTKSNEIGIIITDVKQSITHVNPGFTHITGYSFKESIGRNCNFLQGKETAREAVKAIRDCLSRDEQCRVAIINYTKSGKPFWNLLIVTPTLDSNGRISNYVGVQMRRSYVYVDRPMELFPWTTLETDPISSSSCISPKRISPHSSSFSSSSSSSGPSSPSSISPCCTHLCYHCSTIFSSHNHPTAIHVCSSCRDTFLVPLSPREEKALPKIYPSDQSENYFMIKREDLSLSMERELKISEDDFGKADPKLILSPKKGAKKSPKGKNTKRSRKKKKPTAITTTTLSSSTSMPTLKISGKPMETKKDRTIT
jgi:PAS domain S-box-containing protein